MGGCNSSCIPRRTDSEIHTFTSTPKGKGHRRNLSATFNLSVIEEGNTKSNNLVNINKATEEELMTLPGISRAIAKNIIDYRNHIGGFRCVEDVALASGVGAVKLTVIRSDICVTSSASDERNRDRLKEAPFVETSSYAEPGLTLNVNSANIFSLLRVKGIGMAIAKNIVAYRDKHGEFKSLDELLKVKGIGPSKLEVMIPYLTLEDKPQATPRGAENKNNSYINGRVNTGNDVCNHDYVRRSTSSLENILEILGPLAKVPERPKMEHFTFMHKNRRSVRLATWNLERFSIEKASNPGVKDVICMTVLENGLGIVAVQELADKEALNEICQELNSPTLPNVKKWSGKRGKWAFQVSEATGLMYQGREYHGFLYDKSQKIDLIKSCVLQQNPKKSRSFTRMPYLGIFKINGQFDCVVVSVHLKATGLANEDMERTEKEADGIGDIVEAVKNELKDENDIIILGDFNLNPEEKAFDDMRYEGYSNCIPGNIFTNISNKNPSGSKNYDNIWMNKATQDIYTGVSQVIREGLSSPWIPNEWSWGGVVSDHCPVFTQLYVNKDLDTGDVTGTDVSFTIGSASPET